MSYTYDLHNAINLHVEGRITKDDARRQQATARVILQRLDARPGQILADEVGMGKTFVALAVAASVALTPHSRRPVVVMVPPSLKEKWPKDFRLFLEKCIQTPNVRRNLIARSADNAVSFLKLLDDPIHKQASIIFLTHGAMSPHRKLRDGWVKLALIQKALYKRRQVKKIRRVICRYMGRLLNMRYITKHGEDIWETFLANDPHNWLDIMVQYGIRPVDNDDPVPEAILKVIDNMSFTGFYQTLKYQIPYKKTSTFDERLRQARELINEKITELWDHCIHSLKIKLPLLILDEAHHLKNPHTQLASLFHTKEAADDAAELDKGPLAEIFERMLFLTATPFQLGHYELCSVLKRFSGISWTGRRSPSMGKRSFLSDLDQIRKKLDAAQQAAVSLDRQWGLLQSEDITINGETIEPVEKWWKQAQSEDNKLTPLGKLVVQRYGTTLSRMKIAEEALKPYVIRHSRPKLLPEAAVLRRLRFAGKSIKEETPNDYDSGIKIEGEALLPFLLAARVTALRPEVRPVFAEGLASSYQAFLNTRRQREERLGNKLIGAVVDYDEDLYAHQGEDMVCSWYLDKLESEINTNIQNPVESHPKVAATVKKALELWKEGEKVLIFCHYIATGEIISESVDNALDTEIYEIAAKKIGCTVENAKTELERIGQRFFSQDSPIRRATNRAVETILFEYPVLEEHKERILRVIRRYTRTPSFLVRFFPLSSNRFEEQAVFDALRRTDASGMSLEQLIKDFFEFLVSHCGHDERIRYLEALEQIQPGSKVRLANGNTRQEMRQRLMLTFNTPFYPEVLVASMIMAEGVDLHLNCRHVIHHDLCWNPSTLEQRTGRIDRIGAKVERCLKPIQVYLPYISKTQDEKMYRVVMDRERWFKVVMGESYKTDANTTEKIAQRLPFPENAAFDLKFDLSVCA